jgi:hypothetical protein
MSIKKEVGARCIFTNGHERVSPEVEVTESFLPSRGTEKMLVIDQGSDNKIKLSIDTLKSIIAWAEKG